MQIQGANRKWYGRDPCCGCQPRGANGKYVCEACLRTQTYERVAYVATCSQSGAEAAATATVG